MFQLTDEEQNELDTNCDRFANNKFSSETMYVFTELGCNQLSSILNSNIAINV